MANTDFNGDGRDDLLWRSITGGVSNWLATSTGGFTNNDANALTQVDTYWEILGSGDFNGDGRDDILWISDANEISNWLATPSGGFTVNDSHAFSQTSTQQNPAGIGDFNGDGRDDILFWDYHQSVTVWQGTSTGGFLHGSPASATTSSTSWNVAGIGDFNGDGRDDILWRNADTGALTDWLGSAAGSFTVNDANALQQVPIDWQVAGTGDFNGDGRDDILWRNDNGALSIWLGSANGGFTINDVNAFRQVPTNWHVASTGDYNGDGRDDILWRSDGGAVSNWLGTAAGGFTINDAAAYVQVDVSWGIGPNWDPWDYG